MVKIKKRVIPVETSKPERPRDMPCHFTIFRHPNSEPKYGHFHKGAEPAELFAVHTGVIAVLDTTTAQTLFDRICEEKAWYIAHNPGRYSVVATVFGMSFTFIVMHDHTYHPGWLKWPDFLKGERERGISTL